MLRRTPHEVRCTREGLLARRRCAARILTGRTLSRNGLRITSRGLGGPQPEEGAMGDKGGKKNKEKDQKQNAEKQKQKAQKAFDKQPKRKS